jgi:fibronectin-binding autotransporter adhesin
LVNEGAGQATSTGTLTLNAANTYSGGTVLNIGTLVDAQSTTITSGTITSGALGTGGLTLTTGTFEDNGTAITVANSVSIGGNIGFASAGSGSLAFDGTGLTTAATVTLATSSTLTVSNTTAINDTISGSAKSLTVAGTGTLVLGKSTGNTYTGGTTVNAGSTLLVGNTSNSATGTGALNVAAGGTFGGAGLVSASNFTIGAAGTQAALVVGNRTDTTSQLTLAGSGANTITNTKLEFNISATTAGQANELNVGSSAIAFSSSTLALNVSGAAVIQANTSYVLIAGTGTNQYSGLMFQSEVINGSTYDVITSGLSLAFTSSQASSWYATNSFIYLNTTGGVDDIEVSVVPEPSTWAMIIGGLGCLIFWQRRRQRSN